MSKSLLTVDNHNTQQEKKFSRKQPNLRGRTLKEQKMMGSTISYSIIRPNIAWKGKQLLEKTYVLSTEGCRNFQIKRRKITGTGAYVDRNGLGRSYPREPHEWINRSLHECKNFRSDATRPISWSHKILKNVQEVPKSYWYCPAELYSRFGFAVYLQESVTSPTSFHIMQPELVEQSHCTRRTSLITVVQ